MTQALECRPLLAAALSAVASMTADGKTQKAIYEALEQAVKAPRLTHRKNEA